MRSIWLATENDYILLRDSFPKKLNCHPILSTQISAKFHFGSSKEFGTFVVCEAISIIECMCGSIWISPKVSICDLSGFQSYLHEIDFWPPDIGKKQKTTTTTTIFHTHSSCSSFWFERIKFNLNCKTIAFHSSRLSVSCWTAVWWSYFCIFLSRHL